MNPGDEIGGKFFWQIFGLILIALLAYMFFPFLDVIIYGTFVYYVARPMYASLVRRFGHERLGAFISLFIVVLPIALISIYALSIAYFELSNLLIQVEFAYMDYVNDLFEGLKGIASNINHDDISTLIDQGDIWGLIAGQIASFSGSLSSYFNIPFKLFITFIIAYYLLKDGAKLRKWTTYTFIGGKTDLTKKFFDDVDFALHQVFFGNILTAILTTLIASITFCLLNLVAPPQLTIPYPILLGILLGLGIFIPVLGEKLIWIPLTIYLFIQAYANGILSTAWWFILLFFVVVSLVVDTMPEFVLRPYITRKQIHVGALLLAYIFGITVFGFLGLFLGPMILIIATSFMKIVLPDLRGKSNGMQNFEDVEV
ncbi:MAG: AI-2E family transporter [Halobacteriota archaeon]|nr:AI-2E family transporter [Halobacteriota archaeon]